jgi:hypothetical protein
MNAARVFGLISLIPDRALRLPSGTLFTDAQAAGCKYPERIAHLCRFLSWLGPLDPLSREDQQVLGLRAPNGRPIHAADLEEDELPDDVTAPDETGTQIAVTAPSTYGGSHA